MGIYQHTIRLSIGTEHILSLIHIFAHPRGQKGLSQHIVELVGPGVVQILPLQIDLRPAQIFRHLFGKIQPGWPPRVFIQKLGELPVERARMKLKGIDGDPHKRWSMWFNSKQREEPYQVLTSG